RAEREAVRHREFSQLLRDLHRVRAGRSGIRRGLPPGATTAVERDSRVRRVMKTAHFFLILFSLLTAARLFHLRILLAEEGPPMAAAAQLQAGKTLYRDIWFDKPALLPAAYLLWQARPGWPLRLAGSLYALLACALAYRFAASLWGAAEARWAAGLLAFFLV